MVPASAAGGELRMCRIILKILLDGGVLLLRRTQIPTLQIQRKLMERRRDGIRLRRRRICKRSRRVPLNGGEHRLRPGQIPGLSFLPQLLKLLLELLRPACSSALVA
jgi:hypothetical protein